MDVADSAAPGKDSAVDLLDLDSALARLAEVDERKAEVVQMRYFGGFSIEEVAGLLEVSVATVKRDWMLAKAWLYRELHSDSEYPS
jgi:RNA polymerase sigma factor (sigma-70 family)